MSVTLLPAVLTDAENVIAAIDRADDDIRDLIERLRKQEDHARIARLHTALNRLEDARRTVEGCFR